jgi:hypothetical protein
LQTHKELVTVSGPPGTVNRSTGQATGSTPALQHPAPDADTVIVLAFPLGSATALGASSVHRRFFKRIMN